MTTTMADGAEQRLDAQIAEALFGQPGMSKMDVANRVRELRGDGPPLLGPREGAQDERARFEAWAKARYGSKCELRGNGDYYIAAVQNMWVGWQAALSAQPSPGGQGALVQEALEYFERAGDSGDRVYVEAIREALAVRQPEEVSEGEFRAAASRQTASAESNATAERIIAAARQPHGEESCEDTDAELQFYREEVLNLPNILIGAGAFSVDYEGDYRAAWANIIAGIERLAARQPVGEFKAVAYQQITPSADDPEVFDAKLLALPPGHPVPEGCTPLYWWTGKDVPPAQAVGLGQFRPPVEFFIAYTFPGTPSRAEGERLLALIDGKAVGK